MYSNKHQRRQTIQNMSFVYVLYFVTAIPQDVDVLLVLLFISIYGIILNTVKGRRFHT